MGFFVFSYHTIHQQSSTSDVLVVGLIVLFIGVITALFQYRLYLLTGAGGGVVG
jgi:cyanate permease